MVPACLVYGFCPVIRLSMLFAVFNRFVYAQFQSSPSVSDTFRYKNIAIQFNLFQISSDMMHSINTMA